MDKFQEIQHSHLDIGGLRLHVAQIGTGESGTVVFLHGFPEIWYSWRHQMLAVAKAGFRAIAPDFRGYGLSSQPPETDTASWDHLVSDLLAILDTLTVTKVFIVAKDFGAKVGYELALHHPDRVVGIVTLGVPFTPRSFAAPGSLPEGLYISRWREPGRAEAEFGRLDAKTVVRNVYILFAKSDLPIAVEGQEIMDLVDPSTPLPPWFGEEDLDVYGSLYETSGFRYPLQVPYRTQFAAAAADSKIRVPALLIMGEQDYTLKFSGMEDYLRGGMVKNFVPDLEITFVPEGTHFIQEQFPVQVNQQMLTFLQNHIV